MTLFEPHLPVYAYMYPTSCVQHDAPVKTVHWIKAPNYSCVMTGSWDKTLKVNYCPLSCLPQNV